MTFEYALENPPLPPGQSNSHCQIISQQKMEKGVTLERGKEAESMCVIMESLEEVKKKSKGKEKRHEKLDGCEFRHRAVKLR